MPAEEDKSLYRVTSSCRDGGRENRRTSSGLFVALLLCFKLPTAVDSMISTYLPW